jgi:poly-gamma-glutamate capsule biosynthesis protein CapA/YwtB (metallophosphatase superfamily)
VSRTLCRMTWSRAALAAAAAGALLAGCAEPAAAPTWERVVAPRATPSVPGTPAGPVELRLTFAGDVHFTGRTLPLLDEPETAFGKIKSQLEDADLTIVNLETAVTERGEEEPKRYHFRAPPAAYDALRAAGIDAASVANNHTLDYGEVGLLDTLLSAEEADFPVFGAGRNADDAYRPWLTEVKGVTIAVVGLSQVHELAEQWKPGRTKPGVAMAHDRKRAVAAVEAARKAADLVIVFMHWGVEGSSCPSGEMKSFAQRMAGAGADIVLGTHAHVLLTDGWIDDTYVHFGMGNFLWYGDSHSTDSGVLKLTVRGRDVVRNQFLPATVSGTGQPVLVSGATKERIEDKLAQAKGCTGLANSPG